jgi:hypothetical protein
MICFLLAGFVVFDCFFFAPAFLWVMSYDCAIYTAAPDTMFSNPAFDGVLALFTPV